MSAPVDAEVAEAASQRLTPTIGLAEAAVLLRCHPDTVRRMAKAGEIPGAKIGRAWVFYTETLLEWLKERCKSQRLERVDTGSALAEKLRAARESRLRQRQQATSANGGAQ